jgi:hypothetical protein
LQISLQKLALVIYSKRENIQIRVAQLHIMSDVLFINPKSLVAPADEIDAAIDRSLSWKENTVSRSVHTAVWEYVVKLKEFVITSLLSRCFFLFV